MEAHIFKYYGKPRKLVSQKENGNALATKLKGMK